MIILAVGILSGYMLSQQYISADRRDNSIIIPIVAVNGDNGTIGNVTFSLVPGSGRVLLDSNPMIDTDMQNTIIISIAYAQQYSNRTFKDKDLIMDFDMPHEIIGGISSGAAITIGIIALLEGKRINGSIVLTGTIGPDGSIRRVGEIREKTLAVRNAGFNMFLVPSGQSRFRNQTYTLQEYFNNTIEVREVSHIEQAAKIIIE